MSRESQQYRNDQLLSHMGWLRNVVRSRLSESQSVDDVMQDVMTDAVATDFNGKDIRAIKPWLYRIAINKVFNFRRSAGRKRRAYSKIAASVPDEDTNFDNTPLNLILGKEKRYLIAKAMRGLSGSDVEILVFKYVHNWSYDAISANLGIGHSKVTHRLRLARKRLRREIKQIMDIEELE